MGIANSYITKIFKIKNLFCTSTVLLIKEKFEEAGFIVHEINLGSSTMSFNSSLLSEKDVASLLEKYGLGLLIDKDKKLVEDIKLAVIELIHHLNNVNSVIQRSDYLVEKLGKSYQHLSKVFSANESLTLEKYIILQKIERIKELINQDEYTLSEIAYMMEYSSVQYLSNQFKKITGQSVSEYRQKKFNVRKSIGEI
ncbi:MAG: AraC family transcriptional regulator [Bacteroidales bacterium]|nr:AraC family transcriptional regulator [Bacteroidales bacterium]